MKLKLSYNILLLHKKVVNFYKKMRGQGGTELNMHPT